MIKAIVQKEYVLDNTYVFHKGEVYDVRKIDIYKWSTDVYLLGFHGAVFDPSLFKFEENGEKLDIYATDRFKCY